MYSPNSKRSQNVTVKHLAVALAIGALTACSMDGPHYTSDDQPDATAGEAPDAQTTCEPSTITCDNATGLYIDCSASGEVSFEMHCPLGCDSDAEKCLDVDPSNGLAVFLDMTNDAPDVEFTGSSSIDTGNGTVINGGLSIEVPSTDFNGMRVFVFHTLKISGTLTAVRSSPWDPGLPALVILVDGDVVIDGVLDVSADYARPGPAGAIDGTCVGGTAIGSSTVSGGGGGGGRVSNGGIGGAPGDGGSAGTAGQAFSGDALEPLLGGCSGGGVAEGGPEAIGGAGGGAVQIVSRTQISLLTTGGIDASGGGGTAGQNSGGGGGGSGGSVLLEAPQIIMDGTVAVSTKGGSGAAANGTGSTSAGSDGGLTSGQAPGGTNATLPDGGAGGARSIAPGNGQPGTTATMDAGGGGGASGRARFNTTSGFINPQGGAAIYSNYVTATIHTRLVPP
jgi:hypothetical protein